MKNLHVVIKVGTILCCVISSICQATNSKDLSPYRESIKALVLMDESVPDKEQLFHNVRNSTDIRFISSRDVAVSQLQQILSQYNALDSIHIVAHAENGKVKLGNGFLSEETLRDKPVVLRALTSAMRAHGDLLFYGCNLAAGAEGQELLRYISEQTGADVAASTNLTGADRLGGDWTLEYQLGDITASLPFANNALENYQHTLPTITFTGLSVADSGGSGFKSLSDANFVVDNTFAQDGTDIFWNNAVSSATVVIQTDNVDAGTADISAINVWGFGNLTPLFDQTATLVFRDASNSIVRTMTLNGDKSITSVNSATPTDLFSFFDNNNTSPVTGVRSVTLNYVSANNAIPANNANNINFRDMTYTNAASPSDSDGSLTAAGGVSEPVGLDTTLDTVGEAADVFDFTLSDGGTADGLAMAVSQVVINVSGTSIDSQRNDVTWRLNGSDASNVTGSYSAISDTITFTGLSISIADGGSEVYTVNAYYSDNTNITEDATFILNVDGDTDLTVGGSGTQMGSTSAITNGAGGTFDVVATALAFTTQPSGSSSGSALTTQPVVTARDAFGNTDADFTETITLTEASAGALSGGTSVAASSGVATFSGLTYTATADQQSFTLTANDQDGVGSNLSMVNANSVTSDVVATALAFNTQPAPLSVSSSMATNFTTVPVVQAQDGNGVVDTGYSTAIVLAEVNGAGSATMSGTGDTDGSGATVTLNPVSGLATFTGLQITYTNSGGSNENFNLQTSSGGLATANSSQLTGLVAGSDGSLTAAGGVSEPVGLDTTLDTVGEAVNVFDFTLSDGGTADGLAMTVSQIVINVSGTSSDTERGQVTWRLSGNDASNVTGVYNSGADTITFSGLSISIAHGGSEVYTVNAYYNDNTNITEDARFILNVDGDTDLTVGGSGSQMGSTSAITNGAGGTFDVVATVLAFATQPSGSSSGSALTTQPVVTARDAFGNTDAGFTETISLTEASAGSLSGGASVAASSGVATFSGLTYTATADQQSFTLTANDQDGVGSNLSTVDANSVTSDVVATQLVFTTQPAGSVSGSALTTQPVVTAQDADGVTDTGFTETVTLTEASAGSIVNSTVAATSGVATFSGLAYTASADQESFTLTANDQDGSGSNLPTSNANTLTSDVVATQLQFQTQPAPLMAYSGQALTLTTVPVVLAVDANGTTDTGFSNAVSVAEINGAGSASFNGSTPQTPTSGVATFTALELTYTNSGASETFNLEASATGVTSATSSQFSSEPFDSDGNLLAAAGVTEPIALNFSADTLGEATDIFDFTLSDGAGGDGLTMDISEIVVNVSGTSSDTERGKVTWRLEGPDASNIAGVYSAPADTITFSGLSISIADGGSEIYTVNAYFNDISNLTDAVTVALSVDGDTDVNVGSSGTQMGMTSVVSNGTGTVLTDNVGPNISSVVLPSDATYAPAENLDFTLNYDESVVVNTTSGTPRLTLTVGSETRYAIYQSGSNSSALLFRYTVTSGDEDTDGISIAATLDTNLGSLQDGAGNNASNTLNAIGSLISVLVDGVAPTLGEVTAVVTPGNDTSPSVTISSTEAGVLAVGGSCGSGQEGAISSGNTTISLTQPNNVSALAATTYNDCTFTVTDAAGNASSPFAFTTFEIDLTAPSVSEITAVTSLDSDDTPDVTISTNEAGTLAVGGSCGSSDEGAIGSGNVTITLTQPDNSSVLTSATYSDCTITVTDQAGNTNTPLTLTSFEVDVTAPLVTEITPVTTPDNDTTPDVTISTSEAGTLAVGGSCGTSASTTIGAGNTTITLTQADNSSALTSATYSDCTVTVTDQAGNSNTPVTLTSFEVDLAAPLVTEVTPVTTPGNDTTPDVTISTDEAGTLAVGGSCGTSSNTAISAGNATITLTQADNTSALLQGSYSDCTLTVTDSAGNTNTPLSLTSFAINTDVPSLTEITPVTTPGNDATPEVTFSSDEAGTLTVGGSCGTSSSTTISAGNTTITLTQADNTSAFTSGAWSDCTLTVTDASLNASAPLALSSFVVDVDAPIVNTNAGLTIDEGDTGAIIASSALSSSDNLSSAADITFTLVAVPSAGTLRNNGNALSDGSTFTPQDIVNNLITYDHDGSEMTSDRFTFSVADALSNSNDNGAANFAFVITLNAQNDAPVTTADIRSTNEDNAVMVDVLANDSDPDNAINAASVTVVSAPSNGSTSVNTGTGVITYTPATDFNGADTFAYTVEDASGLESLSTNVSITVVSQNDAPVAVADMANTNIDTLVSIDVVVNDTDVDTLDAVDATTLAIVTGASNGSAVINANQIDYTPTTGFTGTDSFTYTVEDSNAAISNVATVTVTVIDPNSMPTAANDSATTNEDNAVDISVLDNDSDSDGNLVISSVSVITPPGNGITSVNTTTGEITYTPNADFNGSDSFTYTVQDDDNATSLPASVNITVNSVNDAPVANNDVVTLLEDNSLTINALGNDSDIDGTLNVDSVTVVTQAASGLALPDASGRITYTPTDDFAGNDTFTYQVEDNQGLVSNTATVTLTIDPINDAPLVNNDSVTIVANVASSINLTGNDSDVDGTLDPPTIVFATSPAQGTLSNNNDGTVTYTPNSDIDPFVDDSFTYTIEDDSGATSNMATVSISFMPSSSPTINGTPATEVVEGQSYVFTPTVGGTDSAYATSFTISVTPSWATFSASTGTISGTPTGVDIGVTNNIVISVTDGVTTDSLAPFNLSVVADVDTDGDTISDFQEGIDGTDPNDKLDYFDMTPPVVMPPADIIVDASGLITPVSLAQLLSLTNGASQIDIDEALAILVSDNVDGDSCCSLQAANIEQNNTFLFAPGRHTVSWQAEDRRGNTAAEAQVVHVRPLVSLSQNDSSAEGENVSFRVLLNGLAPSYPFEVPYIISDQTTASTEDHDLVDGSVMFNQGETEATVQIALSDDGMSNGGQRLIVQLDDRTAEEQDLFEGFDADIYDINSGAKTRYQLTITDTNIAPKVGLSATQNGRPTLFVTQAGGTVTVTASINDANNGDTHSLDWSGTDNGLADQDGNAGNALFTFDPQSLNAGRYQLRVNATDNQGASNSASLNIVVIADAPQLSANDDTDGDSVDDVLEGAGDDDSDGIPNYLDNIDLPNVLPETALITNAFLIEADPGLTTKLGQFSLQSASGGALLTQTELGAIEGLSSDEHFAMTDLFDFEVTGLEEFGQQVNVVIPLLQRIPDNAVYRKFINGTWRNFVEDGRNTISSASGAMGICPPPGNTVWQPGLNAGDTCVQLTIEDGGPNDADGQANNAIADPGGIGVQNTSSIRTSGGGSSGPWILTLLSLLVFIRRKTLQAATLLLLFTSVLLAGTPSNKAYAVEFDKLFVEFSVLDVDSDIGERQFTNSLLVEGLVINTTEYDTSRSAYQLAAGYQAHDNVALFIGYADLGEVDVNFNVPSLDDSIVEAALQKTYPYSGSGLTGSARYQYKFAQSFYVVGELGVFAWEGDITKSEGAQIDISKSGFDLWYSMGAGYQISDHFGVAIRYNIFNLDSQAVDGLGLTAQWRPYAKNGR